VRVRSWKSKQSEKKLENLQKRIQQLKKKRPAYKAILDFYWKVKEEQEKIKPSLKVKSISLKKEWKDLLTRERFPLIEKKDFPLDIESSITLFHSLCRVGKEATSRMAEQVNKIEELLKKRKMSLKKMFTGGFDEETIGRIADEFGLDRKVFRFLIHESIRPSIEGGVDKLRNELDPETWLKGYCPVCGSLPHLSLLKGDGGKRFLLCSFCGYQWRSERLFCPFCGNKEQDFLNYFYAEGEETYRIDTCEKCHQYMKAIDARNLEIIDPALEDLATLHLDLLSSQKGYKRSVPNPWTP
jgi:FdhE protein